MIDACERAFTHHVPVIVGPTADHRVERIDQIGGRHPKRGFDSLSDAIQEDFDILAGRLDEQFPIGISAPLQNGLRFFSFLLSASPSVHLATHLPRFGERYGFTLFRWNDAVV